MSTEYEYYEDSHPASFEDTLNALYQAVSGLSSRFDALDARMTALESKPPLPPATPKASTPARSPRAARSKSMKSKGPATTTPAATQTPAPTTIRTITTQ